MAQGTLRIGRIFGIDIELHWLFIILIMIFLVWNVAFGIIWIILFGCVLIHELSHSVTALRNNVKVSRIVLLPIGGASMIDDINVNPSVEFNIAIAGPAMSFLLGGIFGVMVLFMPPGFPTFFVQFLFLINILLGVFNIIPAFPMDGGRVLRSWLQKKEGFYRATMVTGKISRYCMALIILGTVAFFAWPSNYSISDKYLILIWNLLIVFFLYEGMKAEEDSVTIKRKTTGMKLRDALLKDYAVVSGGESMARLYNTVKRSKEHIIITKGDGGNFMLVNLFNITAAAGASRVKDVAVQIPNLAPTMDIVDALSKMEGNDFRMAAVVKSGKLLGIATSNHVKALLALRVYEEGKQKKGFNN